MFISNVANDVVMLLRDGVINVNTFDKTCAQEHQ